MISVLYDIIVDVYMIGACMGLTSSHTIKLQCYAFSSLRIGYFRYG